MPSLYNVTQSLHYTARDNCSVKEAPLASAWRTVPTAFAVLRKQPLRIGGFVWLSKGPNNILAQLLLYNFGYLLLGSYSNRKSPLFSTMSFNWKGCFLLATDSASILVATRHLWIAERVLRWLAYPCRWFLSYNLSDGNRNTLQLTTNGFRNQFFEVKIIGHRWMPSNIVGHQIESDSSHMRKYFPFYWNFLRTETCRCFNSSVQFLHSSYDSHRLWASQSVGAYNFIKFLQNLHRLRHKREIDFCMNSLCGPGLQSLKRWF